MGSSVSRPTSRTSFSVISANASAALLCRSTLSLKERVDNALRGSPVKKLVSERSEVVAREKALAKAMAKKASKEQGQRGVSSEWIDFTASTVLRGADSGSMEGCD